MLTNIYVDILPVNSKLIILSAYGHKMILSAREYASKYAGNCSVRTIVRRIQRGMLPSNHKGHKIGRDWIIEIGEFEHLSDYNITLTRKKTL